LAAPAGLLANGLVEGDGAVGESHGADDYGKSVVAGRTVSEALPSRTILLMIAQDVGIPSLVWLSQLFQGWGCILSWFLAGLKAATELLWYWVDLLGASTR
jgi:hypothetical protein